MLILLIPVKFNVDYGSCEKLEFRTIPSLLRGYLKISLFQIPGLNFIYLYYESNYVSNMEVQSLKIKSRTLETHLHSNGHCLF